MLIPIQPGWRCQLVRYGKAGGYATSEIAMRFPLSHSAGCLWQIGPDRTALNPWTHTARPCRQGWDVKRKSLAALAPESFLLTSPFIEPNALAVVESNPQNHPVKALAPGNELS